MASAYSSNADMSRLRSPAEYLEIAELRRRLLKPEASRAANERQIDEFAETSPRLAVEAPSNAVIQKAASNKTKGNIQQEETMQLKNPVESVSEERVSAVTKLFESTRSFEEKLARLRPVFDQTDRLGADAVASFESMLKLAHSLARLGEAYAPVKAFQAEMASLARDFEPIGGVQKIFFEVSQSLRDQLKAVAVALEPAKRLQSRLAQLAAALEPAFTLQSEFEMLAEVFGPPPADGFATPGSSINGDRAHTVGERAPEIQS